MLWTTVSKNIASRQIVGIVTHRTKFSPISASFTKFLKISCKSWYAATISACRVTNRLSMVSSVWRRNWKETYTKKITCLCQFLHVLPIFSSNYEWWHEWNDDKKFQAFVNFSTASHLTRKRTLNTLELIRSKTKVACLSWNADRSRSLGHTKRTSSGLCSYVIMSSPFRSAFWK